MGRIEVSPAMIDLQWTSLAPYPAGYPSRRMTVQASVRLPDAWQFATALETDGVADCPSSGHLAQMVAQRRGDRASSGVDV
jgi:predicted metalloprotease with PDZ domain